MKRLVNKIALITGGSSGIGLATAIAMHQEGASVVIVGRDHHKLQLAKAQIGERVLMISADAATLPGIEHLVLETKATYGAIDILFANAGICDSPELFATDESDYDRSMNSNVKSVFFLFLKAFPLLREKASVILTSSIAHSQGRPGDPLYAATKAAVRSLGRTFAMQKEVLDKAIRVNVISPGAVETPLTNQETDQLQTAIKTYIQGAVPMKRWGAVQEIANAVLFLASEDSSYITGSDLVIDGGWLQA